MLQMLIIGIVVYGFTIKKGYYSKTKIIEDDELSNLCPSPNHYHVSLHRCSFGLNAHEIILSTIRTKSMDESLLLYYFDCDSKEHRVVESTDEHFYLRFSVSDDNGKVSYYYDNLIDFGTDTITTRRQYYYYVKQLIIDLIIFLYANSFFESIYEKTIDKKIKEVQEEKLVTFYFFDKVDVNFRLSSIFRIFKLILGPCAAVKLDDKADFMILNLEKVFLDILKEGGDFFYDFRNYDKEKYEKCFPDFLLCNIGLMVIDFINLSNAMAKKLLLGDKGRFIFKHTADMKEILKKCAIVTFPEHMNLLTLFQSLRLSRFEDESSEGILYYFDIENNKLIIDLEDQIHPLKEAVLSFISRSKRVQKIISFDPMNIK